MNPTSVSYTMRVLEARFAIDDSQREELEEVIGSLDAPELLPTGSTYFLVGDFISFPAQKFAWKMLG